MVSSIDIEEMLKSALTSKRLTSMKPRELKKNQGELYSFRLEGTGNREGFSEIKIKQVNGSIILKDRISLPKENKGFEEDIVLLKIGRHFRHDINKIIVGRHKEDNDRLL